LGVSAAAYAAKKDHSVLNNGMICDAAFVKIMWLLVIIIIIIIVCLLAEFTQRFLLM